MTHDPRGGDGRNGASEQGVEFEDLGEVFGDFNGRATHGVHHPIFRSAYREYFDFSNSRLVSMTVENPLPVSSVPGDNSDCAKEAGTRSKRYKQRD